MVFPIVIDSIVGLALRMRQGMWKRAFCLRRRYRNRGRRERALVRLWRGSTSRRRRRLLRDEAHSLDGALTRTAASKDIRRSVQGWRAHDDRRNRARCGAQRKQEED